MSPAVVALSVGQQNKRGAEEETLLVMVSQSIKAGQVALKKGLTPFDSYTQDVARDV